MFILVFAVTANQSITPRMQPCAPRFTLVFAMTVNQSITPRMQPCAPKFILIFAVTANQSIRDLPRRRLGIFHAHIYGRFGILIFLLPRHQRHRLSVRPTLLSITRTKGLRIDHSQQEANIDLCVTSLRHAESYPLHVQRPAAIVEWSRVLSRKEGIVFYVAFNS